MRHFAKTPPNCLILGGGALGLLLHYNLNLAYAQNGHQPRIVVSSRTIVPESVLCDLGGQNPTPLLLESHTGPAQSCLDQFSPDTVFLCVPPEKTEEVFQAWLDAFEASSTTGRQVQFVFCNNGCLSPATLNRLQQTHPRFSFVRALFFVGAMRVVQPAQTLVRWTGGKRVVWDWLRAPFVPEQLPSFLVAAASVPSSAPVASAAGEVNGAPVSLGFMQWQREQNIFAAERSKFFTNFMLAAAVGPQLAKNKTLSESFGDSIVSLQAQQFALLWEHHGVNAEQLKSTLLSTAADTGENINSLSYAAVQGKTRTMEWFLQSIDEEMQDSPRQAKLEPLASFLRSVRKNWRMEK
jgi:hypothetical protein